jgi:hypothetical protein
MAQLTEDEWPKDGEPTTSEQEGDRVKGEHEEPQTSRGRTVVDEKNRQRNRRDTVEPDRRE